MSTTTTNMALVKPAGTESADVTVLNANSDLIDVHRHNGSTTGLSVLNLNTATVLANAGDVRINSTAFTYRDNAGSPANHTLGALDIAQTWSAVQTHSAQIAASGAPDIGASGARFGTAFVGAVNTSGASTIGGALTVSAGGLSVTGTDGATTLDANGPATGTNYGLRVYQPTTGFNAGGPWDANLINLANLTANQTNVSALNIIANGATLWKVLGNGATQQAGSALIGTSFGGDGALNVNGDIKLGGGNRNLGTYSNNSLTFLTNNTARGGIDAAGVWSVGSPGSTSGALAADVVITAGNSLRIANQAGTGTMRLVDKDSSNNVRLGIDGGVVVGGAGAGLGFFGQTPAGRGTVTGSRGGNAALASLLTILASYSLITDSSSA